MMTRAPMVTARALVLAARTRPVSFGFCVAAALLSGLLGTISAGLTRIVIDDLVSHRAGGYIAPFIALTVIAAVTALLPQVASAAQNSLRRAQTAEMRDRLLAAVCALTGISRFEDPAFLDRLRMAQQACSGGDQLLSPSLRVIQSVTSVIGFAGYLVSVNPALGVAAIAAAVPRLIMQLRLDRRIVAIQLRMTAANRRLLTFQGLVSDPNAVKELRLFGLGEYFRRRVARDAEQVNRSEWRADRASLAQQVPLSLLSAALGSIGLYWALQNASSGRISIGDVTVFVAALGGIQGGLGTIISAISTANQGVIWFRQYLSILEADDDLITVRDPAPRGELTAAGEADDTRGIEFRDVWFRYSPQSPWVLRGVTLTVLPGEVTALVGLNGAGKSSLVKLLCRFYDPTRGRILWDGVDLRDIHPANLRARLSAIFQDHMRYDLTAAQNIGIGDLARVDDRAAVIQSAKASGIDDVLAQLKRGYDTLLSRIFLPEDGERTDRADLSGGQWQRVAVARGYMRASAGLLILDEPTSGLDAEAEFELHERLTALRSGRSALLISHRLNTIRNADQIAVLAQGSIVEIGTHAELIALGGEYARLFSLQAEGYQSSHATRTRVG